MTTVPKLKPKPPTKRRTRKPAKKSVRPIASNTYVLESAIVSNEFKRIRGEAEEEKKKLENEIRAIEAELNAHIVSRAARIDDLNGIVRMVEAALNQAATKPDLAQPDLVQGALSALATDDAP